MAFSSSSSPCFFTSHNNNNTNDNNNNNKSTNNQSSSRKTNLRYNKHNPHIISASFATSERLGTARFTRAGPSSLYEVLGIQMGADTVEIKSAYRRLAGVVHPDVGNIDSSADEFIKVHSAYATLSDPGKRADYDRSLFVREEMVGRSCSPVGYSGRRWETDQCW